MGAPKIKTIGTHLPDDPKTVELTYKTKSRIPVCFRLTWMGFPPPKTVKLWVALRSTHTTGYEGIGKDSAALPEQGLNTETRPW